MDLFWRQVEAIEGYDGAQAGGFPTFYEQFVCMRLYAHIIEPFLALEGHGIDG